MKSKRKSGPKPGAVRKADKPVDWVTAVCKFADAVEQEGIRMRHPRMQQVQVAINLLSQVARDDPWMQENDRQRSLDRILELLIEATAPRGAKLVR